LWSTLVGFFKSGRALKWVRVDGTRCLWHTAKRANMSVAASCTRPRGLATRPGWCQAVPGRHRPTRVVESLHIFPGVPGVLK
jgi:hypothetical protein